MEKVEDLIKEIHGTISQISKQEADVLADNYEFTKSEAEGMVDISKEFIHTYVHTGRKMPLGGREKSDVSFSLKEIEAGPRSYPKKIGLDTDGKAMYERGVTNVNAYESIRVYAPCPDWVRDK